MPDCNRIFLVGPMAAGKSTAGKQLAKKLELAFLDSDQEIELRTGSTIPIIFDIEGEDGFRKRESAILDELTQKDGLVLATGGGVVLSAENRRILRERGLVVYLSASIETQLKRTRNNRSRPLLQTDNLRQRLLELAQVRGPLYEEVSSIRVEANNRNSASLVEDIIQKLRNL